MLRAVADGAWASERLVGFDIESTGLDCELDEPVSFAFVEFVDGERRAVEAGFALPARTISRGAAAVHGLTRDRLVRLGAMDLHDAASRMASRLASLSATRTPVVGCNLTYDLTIVDRVLSRLDPPTSLRAAGFHGPVLDVLVLDRGFDGDFEARPVRRLDALCAHYGLAAPGHTAESDAEAAVRVLLAQVDRFAALANRSIRDLQGAQAAWHAAWHDAFAERRAHGQGSLFSGTEPWPYAERALAR
jgi:DNA polymerase III subunit epsilon